MKKNFGERGENNTKRVTPLLFFIWEVNMEYLLFALFYFSRFAIVGAGIVWIVWRSIK
jgi:hypothetical protein